MNRLFLIAGHHHDDPGATSTHAKLGGRVTEAELTIELRYLVKAYFEAHNKNQVFIDDDHDTLATVISKINAEIKPDDIMVDLHFNAFNGRASGSEVIVPNASNQLEREIAAEISKEIAGIMIIPNRGVKDESQTARGRIGILRGVGNRILIEVMFKDNPNDMEAYQINKHIIASAIAQIIEKYINK